MRTILTLCIILVIMSSACGCATTQGSVISPVPTPWTFVPAYGIGQNASDGNIDITFLSSARGERIGQSSEGLEVTFRVDNLRSDTAITVYPRDFTLTDSNGSQIGASGSVGSCISRWTELKIGPNQYNSGNRLCYLVPFGEHDLKMRFNASAPSGISGGGPRAVWIIP